MQDRTVQPSRPAPIPVIVTDVQMPIGSMLIFMLKWAIVAIPAAFILIIASAVLLGILRGIGAF